jgi:hypothetical protein
MDEFDAGRLETMGPIDYLVVEFPVGTKRTGEALPLLVDLVDRGVIRILDLAMVRKEHDGTVRPISLTELGADAADLHIFEGASSGLLDQDDFTDAATVLDPGSVAGILVYENSWAGPFASALRRTGGQLVASGRVPVQALLASLDAAESKK